MQSKYGGMEVSDAKKLKALEAENAKLKKLLAEQMMDVSTLKEMLGKNFEARCATQICELGHDRETIQSKAGLRLGRHRPAGLSTCVQAIRRYGPAGSVEGPVI